MKEKVSIVSCRSYDPKLLKAAVVQALEPFGGMHAMVQRGDTILVKPNLLSAKKPDAAVTTHPQIVAAILELVLECGGKPKVGDSPGVGNLAKVARRAGILDVCTRYGAKLIDFDDPGTAGIPTCSIFKKLKISQAVLEADAIINVPKIKTHAQMALTLGVKNLFGCIAGKEKSQWHFKAGNNRSFFARLLLEIYMTVRPAITISDCVIAMEGNGPGSGTPRAIGLIGCAKDAVAHDAIFSTILGLRAEQLPVVRAAIEMKTGHYSCKDIDLISNRSIDELTINDIEFPATVDVMFNLPGPVQRFVRNSITSKPHIDRTRCTKCMKCVEICPPGVISSINSDIRIDYEHCISCFCCQEICPEQAITSKEGWLSRFVEH